MALIKKRASTTRIVVHCAATRPGQDIGAADIDRWHRDRGYVSIGYHFVIRLDGTVEKGRDVDAIGAHASGHNADTVAICLVGGLDKNGKALRGKPEQVYNEDQLQSLAEVILELRRKYGKLPVVGHRDLPNVRKDCPCMDVATYLKDRNL